MGPAQALRRILNHPFNKLHRASALQRFIHWQIVCRLFRSPIIYEWVNGSRFYARHGETGLTGNIYNGLHEFADMAFLLHFLRPDDLFVDIGANSGAYTILACAAIGARCWAFEPSPTAYDRLIANIALNDAAARVRCERKAVGDASGETVFTDSSDATNHVLSVGEKSYRSCSVGVTTLDSSLAHETPSLIKIDVEGFETPVIKGGSNVFRNPSLRAVIMELNGSGNRYGFDEGALCDRMRQFGFAPYAYEPLARTLTPTSEGSGATGNALFLRDLNFAMTRLTEAPAFTLYGRFI